MMLNGRWIVSDEVQIFIEGEFADFSYLPGKNASKLFAAGFAMYNTTCAANVITMIAAVVRAIDELKPMGVVK